MNQLCQRETNNDVTKRVIYGDSSAHLSINVSLNEVLIFLLRGDRAAFGLVLLSYDEETQLCSISGSFPSRKDHEGCLQQEISA